MTATGTINSGVNTENGGAPPAGIVAGYDPGDNQTPNAQVAGNVFVTSDATINAAIGFGIWAFNFGTGDTSVTTQIGFKDHDIRYVFHRRVPNNWYRCLRLRRWQCQR